MHSALFFCVRHHPTHIYGNARAPITRPSPRLDKDQYSNISDFVMDLRLIAANCLQFNTTVDDSLRPEATEFLTTAEDLCKFFVAKPEVPNVVYPALLHCWADCLRVIDELINMTNPGDKMQTAWFFLQPVTYFCGGEYPHGKSAAFPTTAL
jgi:hypothetical protein